MTDTPYLTRAREWMNCHAPPWADSENDVKKLAALLLQVRNEALEEVAKVAAPKRRRPKYNSGKYSNPVNRDSAVAFGLRKAIAADILALKEPRALAEKALVVQSERTTDF